MTFPRIAALALLFAAACAHRASPQRTAALPAPDEFFMNVDGQAGRLRVSVGGTGAPAVVLVHGLGSDLEVWRGQLDHLRQGRCAIAYDQRGHGGSDTAVDGVYTIDALAADLDAVVSALRLDRFVLVGHSLSGEILTAYAGAHPEKVAGLVYVDALGDFSAFPTAELDAEIAREAEYGAADWRREFDEMLGTSARPETRAAVLASIKRTDPAVIRALRRSMVRFAARPLFARWRGPAIAVEVAESQQPVLASKVLGIPRTGVPAVSHWLMLDDPAALDRALDAFLATVR